MRSKYIPVMLNLVIVVTGMTSIGIGAYGKIQSEPYLDLVRTDFPNYGFIIWGVAICVLPFLLSLGSQESDSMNCKLVCFSIIAIGLVFCYFFVMMDDGPHKCSFRNVVEKNMVSGLEKYGKDGHGGISNTWDLVQRDFHCCGVLSFTDWSGVTNFSEGQTPDSCCKKVPEVVGCGLSTDAGTKNAEGCLKDFDDMFFTYFEIVMLVILGITYYFIALGEDEERERERGLLFKCIK